MRLFVESLKRLYQSEKVSEQHIRQLQIDGKITLEEMEYIFN